LHHLLLCNMPQRVLIIGGGLSGLALAQGLTAAIPSIPFRIFERDSSAAFRAQGYRIRISGAALQALLPAPLLPDFPILDTEGRSIFGKTDLTDQLVAKLPEEFMSGMCLASVPGPASEHPSKLLFEVMRFDPAARALGLGVPADYIYWVLCTRQDVTDTQVAGLAELLSLSSAESAALAQALMRDWHESVRAIVDTPNDDSTATLAFFSCTKEGLPRSWAKLRRECADTPVTLIGDAAHPMPPVGGVGANSAFQDVLELFEALKSSQSEHESQGAVLMRYEQTMVERVVEAIERSSSGAVRFFGMKPQDQLKPAEI
ncbi:hypothetical protein LLEC1_04919, partial [Akanthomyces lecanii]